MRVAGLCSRPQWGFGNEPTQWCGWRDFTPIWSGQLQFSEPFWTDFIHCNGKNEELNQVFTFNQDLGEAEQGGHDVDRLLHFLL